MKWLSLIPLFLFLGTGLMAQGQYVRIDNISVKGNSRTKDRIVLRELPFAPGDSISIDVLEAKLQEAENRVMNTGLFTNAEISIRRWVGHSNEIDVNIDVVETLYFYPVPIFELADRNFNVWWVEQGRSLSRTNYGLDLVHLNISGHRDKLKLNAKSGYTRRYSFSYDLPFLDNKGIYGMSAKVSFSQNREVNYITLENKQRFLQNQDSFIYKRFEAELGGTYRPSLNSKHEVRMGYHDNWVNDSVAIGNPAFFLGGRTKQQYFRLKYTYTYDSRDIRPYPINGQYIRLEAEQEGFGVFGDRNSLTLSASFSHFTPIYDKLSMGIRVKGKYSVIRSQQPYNDNRGLGYGNDVMHGHEYYVVDGMDVLLAKSTIRYNFLDAKYNLGKYMPLKSFRRMPLKLFLSLNNDIGMVNDPYVREFNIMTNRLLWGGGLGLDVVVYYDKVLRIEYSFNQFLERGLFIHLDLNI